MKNRILSPQPLHTDLGILMLRLFFGGMFIYFGYNKLKNYDAILPNFGDIIGIGSGLSFHLVIFAEFFCGIFVAVGLLTRLSVIPIFITMIVAYFIAHAADPFQQKMPAFIFLVLSLVIFVLGSGRFSADRLIFRQNRNK